MFVNEDAAQDDDVEAEPFPDPGLCASDHHPIRIGRAGEFPAGPILQEEDATPRTIRDDEVL